MGDEGRVKAYDVETPALLLHLDVVERNLAHMAARARQLGVALRPHAKTHKCVELGRLQLEHGARGLTVATLVEAEVFARAGFSDLTWAFPIDPGHVAHARRIVQETGATLRVVVDDLGAARALAGSGLRVWLKVDCGYHRAGVDPASDYAVAVARELARERGLSFDGILSHSGHAYRTTSKADAAALELSKDAGPAHVGPQAMGAVKDAPDLTVATLSQEHGLIRAASAATLDGRFKVGDTVEIIPNHSCLTVAHFDVYHVIRGTGDGGEGRVVDRWKVERGR